MSRFNVDTISTESSPSFQAPPFQTADYEGELDRLNNMAQQAEPQSATSKPPKENETKGIKRLERFEVQSGSGDGQEDEHGGEDDENGEEPAPKKKPARRQRGRGRKKSSSSDAGFDALKKGKDDTDDGDDDDDVASEAPLTFMRSSAVGWVSCCLLTTGFSLPHISCRTVAKKRRANPGKVQHGRRAQSHERPRRPTARKSRAQRKEDERSLPTTWTLWRA